MLKRSNVNFAKRIFLDRLTTDHQKVVQLDEGPGDEYQYAGTFDPFNFGISADCSGLCGIVIGAALYGTGMSWGRKFTTESFPGPFGGFRRTTQADLVNGNYPIKVMIHHGGGGPYSHMACIIDGWNMESNGTYGVCTKPGQVTNMSYWNDWWVFDGPIIEDTSWRQSMSYPLGVDYAGGRISAADLKAAGVSFVCRYLTDGGRGLPGKQLLPAEFTDLVSNGINVVFNWETTANFMLNGRNQGVADATQALNYIRSLPGVPAGYWPVVYFSCDFDEAPSQDAAIFAYLQGAASVLNGMEHVGIYGGYWICTRAQKAVGVKYVWQTEAWSGGNITSAVNIMQRNGAGFKYISGVQCDINEAHTDDFGQYRGVVDKSIEELILEQLEGPVGPDGKRGWPQLGGRSLVDALSLVGKALNIDGFAPIN